MSRCSVPNCNRPIKTKGWCQAHYMRWWYTGDVRAADPIEQRGLPLSERFWRLVQCDAGRGACWAWQGSLTRGYGTFHNDGRTVYAHRVSYELANGPIPDGMQLDHLCHTRDDTCKGGPTCPHRRCVNPAHLEPVTNQQNCERGRAGDAVKRRAVEITHCPKGHPYDDENTAYESGKHRRCKQCNRDRAHVRTHKARGLPDPRRTPDATIQRIRELAAAGMSKLQIAEETGVGVMTVYRYLA